jgi:adenine-specific DNA-methyltransferase
LEELIGCGIGHPPKPLKLLEQLIYSATPSNVGESEIILDFFAGSGTTGHAVYRLKEHDDVARRFILVQYPEACPEDSDAYKRGFKTIADLARYRLKEGGRQESDRLEARSTNADYGFRHLFIDTVCMTDVYYAPDALDKTKFDLFVDNIKADRTDEDLLFQVMLDWGLDLALPITRETIQGIEVLFVDGNALVACFNAYGGLDEDFVKALAKHQPMRVVFRDAGFKDSAAKINVEQIFKQLSPSTEVKCL